MEGFRDGSGLFGAVGQNHPDRLVVQGLATMPHRGGVGTAIAVGDGTWVRSATTDGMPSALPQLSGARRAIGLISGGLRPELHTGGGQRMVVGHSVHGTLACALAGRFTNGSRLRRELKQNGALFQSESDAEVLLQLVAQSTQRTPVNRLVDALWKVDGAFCALLLGPDVFVAVRDPRGFRPLFVGEVDGALVVASERTAVLDLGGRIHRPLAPGEMVIAHPDGIDTVRPFPPQKLSHCVQEVVGLSRVDSQVFERSPYRSRVELGERLAMDAPCEGADLCVPIPGDEPYANGYARQAGLPMDQGITTTGRANKPVVHGRTVVLVGRALLTGDGVRQAVQALMQAGAVDVHVRIATPAVQRPCLYGVPSPTIEELAWTNRPDLDELAGWMGATSVQFQAIQGVRGVLGAAPWCHACLSGEQPVVPEEPDDQLPLF